MPRILVVEDDEKIAALLVRSLVREGHEVTSARTGEEALKLLAAGEQPNLVLMDISLPGIDGLEVTRRLKAGQATRLIPVLALTGHALLADRELCLAAGCDDYEPKPLDLVRVASKVERLLARRSRMERMLAQRDEQNGS